MFEHLTNLFTRRNESETELSLLKKKFRNNQSNPSRPYIELNQPSTDMGAEAVDSESATAIAYWKDRQTERTFHAPEPHVLHVMSHSSTVMQPGSAENFLAIRQHPLDELEARRNRNANNFNATRFLQRSKGKKTSA